MPGPKVMLASTTKTAPSAFIAQLERAGGWWFDVKWDGIRAVVGRDATGAVSITNRRQADIAFRYPDVVAAVAALHFVGVLDGEIIVMSNGRPDFTGAHLRDAQSTRSRIQALAASNPATFIPFDVLEQDGRDVRDLPYAERRDLLAGLHPAVSLSSQDGATMWAFVVERGLEGLIAKRADRAYRVGRHASWVKLKQTHRVSALVTGVVPGKGSRGPVGALRLALFDPDAGVLVSIGSVGSGMTEADLRALSARIRAQQPTVVEVEYLEVSASGQLRMPVFRGITQTVDPGACVISTLRSARKADHA